MRPLSTRQNWVSRPSPSATTVPDGCRASAAYRGIKRGHPDRMPPSAARSVAEVVVEPIDDLDRTRILEQRPTGTRGRGPSAEIPQQRFRYPG
jgi:hypothetical protein